MASSNPAPQAEAISPPGHANTASKADGDKRVKRSSAKNPKRRVPAQVTEPKHHDFTYVSMASRYKPESTFRVGGGFLLGKRPEKQERVEKQVLSEFDTNNFPRRELIRRARELRRKAHDELDSFKAELIRDKVRVPPAPQRAEHESARVLDAADLVYIQELCRSHADRRRTEYDQEKTRLEALHVRLDTLRATRKQLKQRHEDEIAIYKMRISTYTNDSALELTQKAEACRATKNSKRRERRVELRGLRSEVKQELVALQQVQKQHQATLGSMQAQRARRFSRLCVEYEQRAKTHAQALKAKLEARQSNLKANYERELRILRHRADKLRSSLYTQQDQSLVSVSQYFLESCRPHDVMLRALQEQRLNALKKVEESEAQVRNAAQETSASERQLRELNKRVTELTEAVKPAGDLAQTLRRSRAQQLVLEDTIKNEEWKIRVLVKELRTILSERDELHVRLEHAVAEVRRRREEMDRHVTDKIEHLRKVLVDPLLESKAAPAVIDSQSRHEQEKEEERDVVIEDVTPDHTDTPPQSPTHVPARETTGQPDTTAAALRVPGADDQAQL